jgi:hypothetical protein
MADADISRVAYFRTSALGLAAFATGIAAMIGLAGPFGMAVTQPNILLRVAHFVIVAWVMTALTVAIATGLSRWRPQLGLWALVLGAVLAALPGVLIVRASLYVFSRESLSVEPLSGLFAQTLSMNVVLALLGWRVLGGEFKARRIAEIAKDAGPGLAHRLPPELRSAPIFALQAEDHYLRVHTARGDALIHMRIGDAEQILAAEDGVRTHRSFWIARRAFQGVDRKAGRMTLRLSNGLEAPVSRARMPAVNAWLEKFPT